MTQAFNLALLANAVNTSGQLNVGTNSTGTLPVVNGGTGQTTYTNGQLLIGNTTGNTLTKANLTAGSGISITNGAGSITIAASGAGTVTSVATGNGLQGGTITTTGTLSVACPGFNTVGSYCFVARLDVTTSGSNYGDLQSVFLNTDTNTSAAVINRQTNLSGTWKWMGASASGSAPFAAVGCRVS